MTSDRSGNSARTQAAGTHVHGLVGAVDYDPDFSHVGLPSSVGSAVGMGYVLTEGHALAANITLCHIIYTSIHGIGFCLFGDTFLLYHIFLEKSIVRRFFFKKLAACARTGTLYLNFAFIYLKNG